MTERMRITADGMTISRDKDGNVQWIQVEGVTLVRKQRAEKAEQTIEKAMRYAFEAGYGAGHNDTVEGMFSLDEETMAEEWLADIKSDGTFKAILNRSKS